MAFKGQNSRSTPKNFEVEYLESGKMVSIKVKYGLSNGQDQTLKALKSNRTKTVRDREKVSMGDK